MTARRNTLTSVKTAKPQPGSYIPPELEKEFEAQTYALLRERFLWFSGILAGLSILSLLLGIIFTFAGPSLLYMIFDVAPDETKRQLLPKIVVIALLLLGFALYATCFMVAKQRRVPRERFLHLTFALVVCDGLLQTFAMYLPGGFSLGIFGIGFTHFLACCFLPWTPKQAIQPLIPVLGVWAILKLTVGDAGFAAGLVQVSFALLVGVPGVLLCMIRHTRRAEMFERAYLYRRYRDVRRELYDARRIHEALFPKPIEDGPVRVVYRYEPMQQIGGDYFFAFQTRVNDADHLSVVLLDVTGHGILAALTVNRIYGELSRIFAERPDITPAEVLRTLNRYTHLTLAPHSVYVTALCARVDPTTNTLHYANGGHPPAYLKRSDGTVQELVSTTFLLGPCDDQDYDPGAIEVCMMPGDVLLAYTDGVIESRGLDGKLWGLAGIRNAMQTHRCVPGTWAQRIIDDVESHRLGPAEDDTLVVEIWRAVEVPHGAHSPNRERMVVSA
jgi:serine phosphatase RsbU (regulator of sigma subunit)